MKLAELLKIAHFNSIVEPPEVDWDSVETQLSLKLPTDYKALLSAYGAGTFSKYIHLPDIAANVSKHLKEITADFSILEEGRRQGPGYFIDLPLYPETGGLFPWGFDDNAGILGWLTSGDPDSWPIITTDGDCTAYDRFDMTITEFLFGWLNGDFTVSTFPEDVQPVQNPLFVSEVRAS